MPHLTKAIYSPAAGEKWMYGEIELSDVGDDELLIEIVAGGICHADIKAGDGTFMIKPPLVLGHEGCGYVREVGKQVAGFRPGDSVVLSYASCGSCRSCRFENNPYCSRLVELNYTGTRADGSYPLRLTSNPNNLKGFFFGQSSLASLALIHSSCATKVDVPGRGDLQKLVIGCGIQTGAGTILNSCKPCPGQSVAIWGCGAVGLSAIMAAKLFPGVKVIAIDLDTSRFDLATRLGAHHVINGKDDVDALIREYTDGLGVDFALDAVGHPEVLRVACKCIAVKGTLVSIGAALAQAPLSIRDVILNGTTYKGVHQGDCQPRVMIPHIVELWKSGQFPFDMLLQNYPVEDFERALEDLKAGKVIKPVLLF